MSIATRIAGYLVTSTAWNELVNAINLLTPVLSAMTAISFSAGAYTGSGSMTWTVGSGDVSTAAYLQRGQILKVAFVLSGTTVGGTPASKLRIAIPNSKVATRYMTGTFFYQDNGTSGSAVGIGFWQVQASATLIEFLKPDQSAWSAATDATGIYMSGEFEVN